MKIALAVAALAAFCACAAAAASASQHLIFRTVPESTAVLRFEIPLDPDVHGPEVDSADERLVSMTPEKLEAFSGHPETTALAPAAFSAVTLFAFGAVVILSQRNLRAQPGGRRRVKRLMRPMACL